MSKLSATSKSVFILLVTVLSIGKCSPAVADWFSDEHDRLNHNLADISTLGDAGKERDREACIHDRDLSVGQIQNLANTLQGSVEATNTAIASDQKQIEEIQAQIIFVTNQELEIEKLQTLINTIETNAGASSVVAGRLNKLMEQQRSDRTSLSSWAKALQQLVPKLSKSLQPSAKALQLEISSAANIDNAGFTHTLIQALNGDPSDLVNTVPKSVAVLKSMNDMQIENLKSEVRQLNDDILSQTNAGKALQQQEDDQKKRLMPLRQNSAAKQN